MVRAHGRVSAAIVVLIILSRAAAAPGALVDNPITPGESLTVERAIEIALRYHPARQAAASQAGAAVERVGEARSALLPQVFGIAQYLRATDNGIGSTTYLTGPGIPREPSVGRHVNQLTDTFNNYMAGVSAYQYLFDFGRTEGFIAERNAEADMDAARLEVVQLDLAFQVSQAYFNLVAAREIVHVFEQAIAQREEQLHEAQVKTAAGLRPEIDVYTAQAALARMKLGLVNAQNDAATTKVSLDNAMGLGESAPEYTQSTPLNYSRVPGLVDPFLDQALAQRPDLKVLLDEAQAVGAQIRQYRSDYLPSIGATVGYSVRGQDDEPGNNYHAGVIITWPMFNGFLTDHQVSEAKLRQQAVEHGIQDLRQQVILQVKRSFLDWQASVERVHQAEQTLEASRVELDLANKRYENGLGSIIELTDAQQRFTEDEAQRVNALASFSIAKAALDRDTATGPGATLQPPP
jgi:outer membrane protein TolC